MRCLSGVLVSNAVPSLALFLPTDVQQILPVLLLTNHMLLEQLFVKRFRHYFFLDQAFAMLLDKNDSKLSCVQSVSG